MLEIVVFGWNGVTLSGPRLRVNIGEEKPLTWLVHDEVCIRLVYYAISYTYQCYISNTPLNLDLGEV